MNELYYRKCVEEDDRSYCNKIEIADSNVETKAPHRWRRMQRHLEN